MKKTDVLQPVCPTESNSFCQPNYHSDTFQCICRSDIKSLCLEKSKFQNDKRFYSFQSPKKDNNFKKMFQKYD